MPTKTKSTAASESIPIDETQHEKLIGKRIKGLREQLGLNFEELAALTRQYDAEGIAPVTLRRYEREDKSATLPGPRELRILCDALDASADYLLRGPQNQQSEREKYIQTQFAQFVEFIKLIAREDAIDPNSLRHPERARIRQEKLNRARLHTKAKTKDK